MKVNAAVLCLSSVWFQPYTLNSAFFFVSLTDYNLARVFSIWELKWCSQSEWQYEVCAIIANNDVDSIFSVESGCGGFMVNLSMSLIWIIRRIRNWIAVYVCNKVFNHLCMCPFFLMVHSICTYTHITFFIFTWHSFSSYDKGWFVSSWLLVC